MALIGTKAQTFAAMAALAMSLGGSDAPSIGISKGHTPNKYQPHSGAKEKARRLKQLAKQGASR